MHACVFLNIVFFWDGLQLESESKHKLAECMMSNSAVVVHLRPPRSEKKSKGRGIYVCAWCVCARVFNQLYSRYAGHDGGGMRELLIDLEEEFR